MPAEATADVRHHGRSVALWAGVLGSIAAWGLQLNLGYALVPWVCKTQHYIVLHLVTLVFFLFEVLAFYLSYRDWKVAGGGSLQSLEPNTGGPISRTQFLGGLGMLTSTLAGLSIIAQGLASFFLNACWL
jgi:hypothetical protein